MRGANLRSKNWGVFLGNFSGKGRQMVIANALKSLACWAFDFDNYWRELQHKHKRPTPRAMGDYRFELARARHREFEKRNAK